MNIGKLMLSANRNSRCKARYLSTVSLASAFLLGSAPVFAQAGEDADQTAEGDASVITVVGTRVAGAEAVGSTIATVDREMIVASGAATIADVVAQVPSLSGISLGESSKGGNSGTNFSNITAANIRGLGSDATLTLLEGRRLAVSGPNGNGVDINSVPTIALERVEVLSDGASAVYGSDAIAGVVNLVLRRNVDGLDTSARYGVADDYSAYQFGAIAGHRWDWGQFTVAGEYSGHSDLGGEDRDFNRHDLSGFGGNDYSLTQCAPANAVVGSTFYPVDAQGNFSGAGTPNMCEPYRRNALLPEIERIILSANFDLDFTDRLRVSFDGQFSRREYNQQFAHTPQTLRVGSNNPYFKLPAGVNLADLPLCATGSADRCLTVNWDPYAIAGTRNYQGWEKVWSVHPYVTYDLGGDWQFKAEMTYAESNGVSDAAGFDTAKLPALARSSDPNVAIDPFGNSTSQATIDLLLNRTVYGQPISSVEAYALTASGTLGSLPGGDIRVALNGEHRAEELISRGFTGQYGSALQVVEYLRKIDAVAGELIVPLVGSANSVAGVESLTLSAALRYENYSDFGATTNPRFAIDFEPVPGLMFKANYSTSFHAPKPVQLVSRISNTIVRFNSGYIDANGVARTGATLQFNSTNLNLRPETSENYSFGFEANDDLIEGLRFGATYFSIRYTDKIAQYFNDPQILTDPNLAFLVTLNPTQAQIDAFNARGTAINYIPSGQTPATVYALVDAQYQNLGSATAEGVDFNISYDYDLGDSGNITAFLNGTYLMNYIIQVTPGGPSTERVDDYDYPTSWRARGGIGWTSPGGLRANIFANYTGSYYYDTPAFSQKIDAYTTFDLSLAYTLSDLGPLESVTLSANLQNAFDTDPPFVNIAPNEFNGGGFDGAKANPIGRMLWVSLSTSL
jgi:iron complex outermembrane recepter protein